MTSILVIQTAFPGDLILTLPLVQETARLLRGAGIDVLCAPRAAGLLRSHPDIRSTIVYDKRGNADTLPSVIRRLRRRGYDLCLSPHRSLRSALLARCCGAPIRAGFDRSAAPFLFTHRAVYRSDRHEIERNLSLLSAIGQTPAAVAPRLYPSERDIAEAHLARGRAGVRDPYICIAPGSVWPTKRWTADGYAEAARLLADDAAICLIGGEADRAVCADLSARLGALPHANLCGALDFPASAVIIRDARVLISNDSAPVHMASAVGTPVVAVFGPTVPAFGFAPFGVPYRIAEVDGLACRPCAIHGGQRCPIGTLACMTALRPSVVAEAARDLMRR